MKKLSAIALNNSKKKERVDPLKEALHGMLERVIARSQITLAVVEYQYEPSQG